MAHWVKKIVVNKWSWVYFLFLFSLEFTQAQTEKPVRFLYTEPRNGKQKSASYFLDDFALRANVPDAGCYFAMGYFRFHLAETGKIDSVAFNGDLREELKKLGENKILESQKYWLCKTCTQTKGHWFTLPVYVAYTTATPCPDNPIYSQSVLFWDNLFKNNQDEQLQIAPNEWLLAPIYAIKMR
ncbi:hypothetical protein [Spirosoma endbachense]|uniref:Uncharacterized protein n=1 Tax=Spirosoma endbachense TaxID=2666025 RepID=A0A6P1VYZ2_9BACT|nr:hypothetical protein [Spirosoma endbachense]QHV97538.1 hypothetical protein GJR95_22140 [Spirosoma endbachense]